MNIFTALLLLVLGFVLLIKGADYFVDGASSVAKKFRIPSIIIGFTIVAIGIGATLVTRYISIMRPYTTSIMQIDRAFMVSPTKRD